MATEGDPGLKSGLGFPKAQPRAEHRGFYWTTLKVGILLSSGEALELRVNSSGICVPFDRWEPASVIAAELIRECKCVGGKLGSVQCIA